MDFSISLGSASKELRELPDSAQEAQELIYQRLVKGSGRLLEYMGEENSMQGEKMLDRYLREITHAAETLSTELADQAAEYLQEKVRTIRNPRGCEIQELISCAADIFGACVQMQDRLAELEKFRKQCEQCSSVDRLIICVSDDGVGMDEEKLAALNRKLGRANDSLNSSEEEKGGIALVNVNNRIHLIFGDEYGMHVYSVPQRGTDVEITIPLTENDREVKNRSVLK